MPGSKRRGSDRYSVFDSGDPIPRPDLSMFKQVCRDAAQELGMDWKEVYRLYKLYVYYSLKMAFPEDNPRDLTDDDLLNPRRIITIRGICTAEVTESSLWGFRQMQKNIENKKKK